MKEVNDFAQAAVNLITALLVIIIPIIITWTTKRLGEIWNNFKLSQPENVQNLIEFAINTAIDFAEKLGAERAMKEFGKSKIELAMDAAKAWLKLHNIEVDDTVLRSKLESSLFNDPLTYPEVQKDSE